MESCNISQIEKEIADFYYETIPTVFNLKNRQLMREAYSAMKDIRQLKHDINKRAEKLFFSSVQFQKPSFRFAYMYAYSVLHSMVVYYHFLNYSVTATSVISECISMRKLRLCCLGGGPGIEAVAICKVIQDLFLKAREENTFLLLDVYVTVVDICKEWEEELMSVVEAVNRHTGLLDPKRIKLHAKFLQADLLKPLESNVKEEINEANITTMVKLVSAIAEKTPDKVLGDIKKMIKNVQNCMKEGNCLLLLDNSGGSCFRQSIAVLSGTLAKMETMAHKKCSLNPRTLQKMEKLVSFDKKVPFSLCIPTRMTTVSSCVWIKKSSKKEINPQEENKNVKLEKVKKNLKSKKKRKCGEVTPVVEFNRNECSLKSKDLVLLKNISEKDNAEILCADSQIVEPSLKRTESNDYLDIDEI